MESHIRTELYVSPLYRLVRRVDPHGPTLECLHQLRAGSSADLARARAGLKKCGHRFPEIRDVVKKGLGVTISLVYQAFGIVAAEEPVVLQGPGVLVRTDSMHLAARRLNSSSLP